MHLNFVLNFIINMQCLMKFLKLFEVKIAMLTIVFHVLCVEKNCRNKFY